MRSFAAVFLGIAVGITACAFVFSGCSPDSEASNQAEETAASSDSEADSTAAVLRLASTTSTRDSGLLEVLLPVFEEAHGCRIDLIAVGTGAALKLGEAGDVDVVLVHSRAAEEAFMKAGYGIRHEPVMHNFFLIAGPASDPAGIRGDDAVSALTNIAAEKCRFVSRGDDSGTHKRERALWKQAGGRSTWDEYLETGQGMGATLFMADEMNAYVMTDHGTWLKQSGNLHLVRLVTGAVGLKNPYSVLVVNPANHPAVNSELAGSFTDFLISEQAQTLIHQFEISGQKAFRPDRLPKEPSE